MWGLGGLGVCSSSGRRGLMQCKTACNGHCSKNNNSFCSNQQ